MRVLITFLGGGSNRGYRLARYSFGRTETYQTALFGWGLLQHLHAAGRPSEKLVVFGTPTSFWEHLLRVACPERSEEIAALGEKAQKGLSRKELTVHRQAILDAARVYRAREVQLELVSFLDKQEEQTRFIGQLADLLRPGDTLTMDVTHGLRHQPILCTVAAMVLREARHAQIDGIYYGALELTPRSEGAETPVLRLDPLLAFADWIAALAEAEATGDYGVVANLLRKDGLGEKTCEALAEGFFLHAIGNFRAASGRFEEWNDGLARTALRGPSAIFIPEINRRMALFAGSGRRDQFVAGARDALEGAPSCGRRNSVLKWQVWTSRSTDTARRMDAGIPKPTMRLSRIGSAEEQGGSQGQSSGPLEGSLRPAAHDAQPDGAPRLRQADIFQGGAGAAIPEGGRSRAACRLRRPVRPRLG